MTSQPDSFAASKLRLAAGFLFPLSSPKDEEAPAWRSVSRWLVFWGLAIGIGYTIVFRISWRCFGEYQYIRLLPAAAVLAADVAFLGYRMIAAAGQVVSSRRVDSPESGQPVQTPALVAVVLLILLKYAMLLSLPIGRYDLQPGDTWQISGWVGRFLYPQAIYRPLLLMPLWGRWAMMLALAIGTTAPQASPRLGRLAGGSRLAEVMSYWLVISVLTAIYCSGSTTHLARGTIIGLLVLIATYLAAFFLARRAGGQTESTVQAAGLAGEFAFLAVYLSATSTIYWY